MEVRTRPSILIRNACLLQIPAEPFNPGKTSENCFSDCASAFQFTNASTNSGCNRIVTGLPFLVVDARTWTNGMTASK